jgi:tRNA threonylcarbamoyladenosine biosynthesis protein TsaB
MNILALETSMGNCSVALRKADGGAPSVFFREEARAKGHAEALMPMVDEIMREAKVDFSELRLVATTLGPGSFTGVRIAIAAARAFALVTPAKLWGIDTLSVLAASALRRGCCRDSATSLAIAVDARAGQNYFGLYGADGEKREGPLLLSYEDAAARLPEKNTVAVGSGADLLATAAGRRGLIIETALEDLQPDAAILAELAATAKDTLATLRPLYLRPPDAKPQSGPSLRQ